jgi:uridine phosphorylase
MTDNPFPILDFDPDPVAILNPEMKPPATPMPERVVLCFFNDLLREMAASGEFTHVRNLNSETGPIPIYRLDRPEGAVAVVHPGVGAPLAAIALEELIALGGRKFIACGGCGALKHDMAVGHPVVLDAAVRDEGTSYHYLPPAAEVAAHPQAVAALEAVLGERGLEYLRGKAWTTDAPYRETPARRALRVAQGCEVVEMEAAAFFAVAQFRGVTFGQIVYSGDLVVPEGWDFRGWDERSDDRRLLFELSVAAVLRL